MRAYVDESVHENRGLYLLAAVLVAPEDETRAQKDLLALRPPGSRRLHWNKNGLPLRCQSVQLALTHIRQARVYVAAFDHVRRQEDARCRCLTSLLLDHGGPPVWEIVFDGRTPTQDGRDGAHLMAQCHRFHLPHPPRWSHVSSDDEPLLWLPDIVAGSVIELVVHGDGSYTQTLGPRLVIR